MKILAFDVKNYERKYFDEVSSKYNVEIKLVEHSLTEENVSMCKGYDGVTTLGLYKIGKNIFDKLKENNIGYFAVRSIGYNNIDIEYAKKIGIKVCNTHYAPSSVAEFTIMLMLIVLRKYKQTIYRQNVNNFSLEGLIGKTLGSLKVGVIGTGKIGKNVIELLHGFGSEILAFDKYENKEILKYAKYVDKETLYKECDIITVHCPLMESTKGMINADNIEKMKDGVILINAARGELMDIHSLIKGIESKKIGGLGLDVFEDETNIYHENHLNDIISNMKMAYLRQFPNVVMTPHMAFFTEASVQEMVTYSIEGLKKMYDGEPYEFELTALN